MLFLRSRRPAAALALCVLTAAFLGVVRPSGAAVPTTDPALESKVDALLPQLTLEEKVDLCSGDGGTFRGVPRLRVPGLSWSDGPRGPHGGATTAFPVGVLFGSTWDPELIHRAGQVMGNECRAANVGALFGPGINIQRDPLGGRFFEYYTEDPYLNARLTTAIVTGIQSEGVAACLKHFACNNREDNRNLYMSMVDARTLHEIYLPAFRAGVEEAHAWTVMTSANGVNGDFVSDSATLLHDELKGRWGFDGMVLTDWLQTRSTEKAALAGLDVSMPGGNCGFGRPLLDAVKAGRVPVAVIDDKVRRILRTYGRVGLLGTPAERAHRSDGAARSTPEHIALARRVASEGIVLLKNETSLLPLDPTKLKSVLVLGPNADQRFCVVGMGGSSWMQGPYEVTPLAGIRHVLGDRVNYLSTDDLGGFQPIPAERMQPVNGKPGFHASYFARGQGAPAVERVEPQLNFMWEMKSPDAKVPPDDFRAEFVGHIVPPATGTYTLRLETGGEASMFAEEDGGAPTAVTNRAGGLPVATAIVQMTKDKPFFLRISYHRQPGDASLRLTWQPPADPNRSWEKVDAAAKAADAVIVVAGIDHNLDTEGRDRTNLEFPPVQQALIQRCARQNPNTVVVLVNGSPLELGGWLPEVRSVVEAWYPGMEGGNAIADVLFGNVNPSGRLPFTWPKALRDTPSQALGTQTHDRVNYTEGLLVGYRYYDTKGVAPEFPFGHGLSYTTFTYGPLSSPTPDPSGNGAITAALDVSNTGSRRGAVTVQFYVRPLNPSVPRPVHELKAFRKVDLAPGESKPVSVTFGPQAFSSFDPTANAWKLDPGTYEIQACSNSEKVEATARVQVTPSTFTTQP
jgi:beta-glucosidase